jgi:hypothetical protein
MTVFDQYAQEYDRWFEENERIFQAEVEALRQFVLWYPRDYTRF